MKLPPAESQVVERMAPGVLCREGFLGDDPRPLPEILDADAAEVARLNVTHQQLARRLAELLDAAMAGMGATVEAGGGLRVRCVESMGRIPCPWGGCGVFAKGEVEVIDADAAVLARFTPLSVHLIGRHGFYQGRGSRYRMEPASLARLLGPEAETE